MSRPQGHGSVGRKGITEKSSDTARESIPGEEIESARARADSISSHMHNCLAIKMRVVSFYCLRTVLSEYNS